MLKLNGFWGTKRFTLLFVGLLANTRISCLVQNIVIIWPFKAPFNQSQTGVQISANEKDASIKIPNYIGSPIGGQKDNSNIKHGWDFWEIY